MPFTFQEQRHCRGIIVIRCMPIPQSGLCQVATLEQGKSIRTVSMHKPSSTDVRTLVERDLTQQQSRLSDAPRVDDSEDPPPALPGTGCKQGLEQADASYAPTGTANIPTLVRYTRRSPDVTLLARELNRVFQTSLDDLSISWLDGLPELLEEGAKVASLAAKPLAMYSSCVENSGASEADKGLILEFLRARKLAWPDKPRGGVRAPTVFVDLAMNWEMTLWMRVSVLKHRSTPGAQRFLLLPGRRSDVRLFAALHEYWGLMYYHFFIGQQPGPECEMVIKESAESQEALRENDQSAAAGDDVLVANSAALFVTKGYVERLGDVTALMFLSWEFVQMYVLALDEKLLEDVLRSGTYAASCLALLCAAQVKAVYNPVLAKLYMSCRITKKGEALAASLLETLKQKAIDGVSRMSWLDDAARQFFKRQLASTVVRLWPPVTVNNSLDFKVLYPGCPQSKRSFVSFLDKRSSMP
ncbi:hypothetical protein MRX96_000417 [Rhipicephalus microplus]